MKNNSFLCKISEYKMVTRFFDCANYIYLDQIKSFDFRKISKYINAKYISNKIHRDFSLVTKLLDEGDILNASILLRSTYENIAYIIATSFDKSLKVKVGTNPSEFRQILEKNCNELFSENIEPDLFNYIYKYLCKLTHPCSIKEMTSYIEAGSIYKRYVINSIKYIMIIVEYVYLDYIYKKNNLDMNLNDSLFETSDLVNIYSGIRFIKHSKTGSKKYNRFFVNDSNSSYIADNKNNLQDVGKWVKDNQKDFENRRDEILVRVSSELEKSKYKQIVNDILYEK